MIGFSVPGLAEFKIENLVLDYNGTIAYEGVPFDEVYALLKELSKSLKIYILTADTFGKVNNFKEELSAEVHILPPDDQIKLKADFVKILGPEKTIAIGNGVNDSKMLKDSAIGIVVIEKEGAALKAIENADIVCNSIVDALKLILNPNLIVATLRR
jgi:soluble P-type ATPase